MSKQRTQSVYPEAVVTVSREIRAYEEYLAGRTDRETYLNTDSRDIVREVSVPRESSADRRE